MDLLLFLHQVGDHTIWYSGDGLLKFASLIAAGFVQIGLSQYAGGYSLSGGGLPVLPPSSSHQVRLSEKGKTLVEAWLKGDEVGYKKVLASTS